MNLCIFPIVSIIQIEAYIGIWIRQSDNTVIVCNPTSTASLMCIFQGLAINTTYTYKVDGVTLSKLYNHSLTGSYNGKDTITWTNGEVWGKQGTVGIGNCDTVLRYIDRSPIC